MLVYVTAVFADFAAAVSSATLGIFKISKEGLMYLTFQNNEIESEYYMVPQEDGVM